MNHTAHPQIRLSSVLLTLILGGLQTVMPLSIDLYLPALPTIARDLNANPSAVQLTLAVFMIGIAIGQVVYGPVTDKYGRKKPLLFGMVVYILGAIVCALAPTIAMLIGGRFIQALGASASAVITTAIARDLWSGKALADRLSMLFLVIGVAPILAPSLGGLLLTQWNWHALFWLLVIFGVLIALTVVILPETSSAHERTQTRLRGAMGTYAALLRNIPFVLYALTGGCILGVLFTYITGSSFLYIETLGITPGLFAILFSINATGFIGASQVNRLLLRRFSLINITRGAVGAALLLGLALLAVVASGYINMFTLTVVLFALLATMGSALPNIAALALGTVRARAGSAVALQGTIQSVFGGIAGGLVGALGNGAALPWAGIVVGFAALAAVCLFAAHQSQPEARVSPLDSSTIEVL